MEGGGEELEGGRVGKVWESNEGGSERVSNARERREGERIKEL